MKLKTIKQLKVKADKLVQEIGRKIYPRCLVCGKDTTEMHHYIPKSRSNILRYNFKNLIPLCHSCHFKYHHGDPYIGIIILKTKGFDWADDLNKQRNIFVKANKKWYLKQIEFLEKLKEGVK